jgi:hypothetical protein
MSLKEELSQARNEVSLWISTFIALWIHDGNCWREYSRHCGIKFKLQAGGHMFNELSRNWQLLALCGLAAYFLGVISVVWPGIALYVLTLLFGDYALAKGLLGISAALTDMVGVRRCWVPISDKSSVKSVGIQERRMYR